MINDLNLLRVFYYIGLKGSISKAAEELYISQPATSQALKNLENNVGFPLFSRFSKGVKLTTEGKELFNICKEIFSQVDNLNNAINDLKNLDSGVLRIGASDTICKYYLIDILKSFEKVYPNIKYRVTNCTTAESLTLLKNGNVDISFIHSPIISKEFHLENLVSLHDCFVCSYEFDDSKITTLKDLTNYRTLLLENDSFSRLSLDECLSSYNVKLKPKFELASLDLLIEFCKKNMGIICVAKEYIENELKKRELKILNITEKLDERHIALATYDKNYLSALASKFIFHVKNHLPSK